MEILNLNPFTHDTHLNGYLLETTTYVEITSGKRTPWEVKTTYCLIEWKLTTIVVKDNLGNIFEIPYSPESTDLAYNVTHFSVSPEPLKSNGQNN